MKTLTAPASAFAQPEVRRPCGAVGCPRTAVAAVTFRGADRHTHLCSRCLAVVREWYDVEMAVALPCPYPHRPPVLEEPPRLA
jgi:hypothetical protein